MTNLFVLRFTVIWLLFVAAFFPGCRQRVTSPQVEFTLQRIAFQVGDTKVHAHVTQFGTGSLTMVHLHEDERTSAEAGRAILEKQGGRLIQLVHSGRRRVTFSIDGARYSFDPNRIFTDAGVRKTVRGATPVPEKAYATVNQFASQFVRYFSLGKRRPLIALHNNGEGFLSIHSYAADGEYASEADRIDVESRADPDDFFYVTDERFFNRLAEKNFNVVLQNNRTPSDDGSLSVFAARHRIPYVNVEAQSGHLAEQIQMLEVTVQLVKAD